MYLNMYPGTSTLYVTSLTYCKGNINCICTVLVIVLTHEYFIVIKLVSKRHMYIFRHLILVIK